MEFRRRIDGESMRMCPLGLLFLQLFAAGDRQETIEKTLFVGASAQKKGKTPNLKSKLPVKFIFT